jgi:hypothetical protein
MSDARQLAHEMIDRLPEAQVVGLTEFLKAFIDPALAALRDAPLDDEPDSTEDQAAAEEARRWLGEHGGKGIRHAEAMRRLGLE